jgi:hypothetical protein
VTTYVDAVAAVHEWVNAQTTTLVGVGNPLQLGATYKVRDGAALATYAVPFELPASLWGGHENPSMAAPVSMQIYGPTKESAAQAAKAYAEALMPLLQGVRATVTLSTGEVVTIAGVDGISGPQWVPDGNEPRYVVEAGFLFV